MILVRLSGGPLEHTGLIRGMSVSPVYIDGRLIGAISYGWYFPRTPSAASPPSPTCSKSPPANIPTPIQYGKSFKTRRKTTRLLGGGGVSTLAPLGMPIAVAGFSPQGRQVLRDALERAGHPACWTARQGRRCPTKRCPSRRASLAVQLIRGDYSAAAMGTLTWVGDGGVSSALGIRCFCWGHQPACHRAYIHQVIPLQTASFKLGTPTGAVGAVRQDRLPAIAGTLGAVPTCCRCRSPCGRRLATTTSTARCCATPSLARPWSARFVQLPRNG